MIRAATTDPEDPPPRCSLDCDEPADPDDPAGRCERCVYDGLSRCISTGCNGVAVNGRASCRLCLQDLDDCAREDAADAMREDS